MRKLFFIGLLFVIFGVASEKAAAHVLLMDETGTVGAVLHISPDDDPVAGERTGFFLDVQNLPAASDDLSLTVVDTQSGLEMPSDDPQNFVFPARGRYRLVFTINSEGKIYTFSHEQLVSRGVATGASHTPDHQWAEALLLTGVIGMVLLIVVVFNRREDIARQSTF